MQTESMIVKANFQGEIRRCELPVGGFGELANKLGAVFGVKPAEMTLSYVDDEGDKVMLTDDDDLVCAVDCAQDRKLLVNVTTVPVAVPAHLAKATDTRRRMVFVTRRGPLELPLNPAPLAALGYDALDDAALTATLGSWRLKHLVDTGLVDRSELAHQCGLRGLPMRRWMTPGGCGRGGRHWGGRRFEHHAGPPTATKHDGAHHGKHHGHHGCHALSDNPPAGPPHCRGWRGWRGRGCSRGHGGGRFRQATEVEVEVGAKQAADQPMAQPAQPAQPALAQPTTDEPDAVVVDAFAAQCSLDDAASPFSAGLRQLAEMGFDNAALNVAVLDACGGNVELAVDELSGRPDPARL
jgi:hypothetical protein